MGRLHVPAAQALCLAISLAASPSVSLMAGTVSPPSLRLAQAGARVLEDYESRFITELSSTARCSREPLGQPVGTFSWKVVEAEGSRYRVDISMFRDGLSTDRFDTIGVVSPEQNSVEWRGSRAGVNYHWRVLVLTPDGWLPGPTARFIGPVCPVDFRDEPDDGGTVK